MLVPHLLHADLTAKLKLIQHQHAVNCFISCMLCPLIAGNSCNMPFVGGFFAV